MIKVASFSLLLFFFIACNSKQKIENYETIDGWLIVEKFDSSALGNTTLKGKRDSYMSFDFNRYNPDNKIYTAGRKFKFKYHYLDKTGNKFLFTRTKLNSKNKFEWIFKNAEKSDTNSIVQIQMKIVDKQFNDFQTGFISEYILQNGESIANESSGIIENSKNVWMHPPRFGMFQILELDPFPYIKSPFKIGNKWNWSLEIGDHWADKRWFLWTGNIENKYTYEITDRVNLKTNAGILECYVIDSQATSRIGKTALMAYFNVKHGFVKLDYTNIDGTKIIIELEGVS